MRDGGRHKQALPHGCLLEQQRRKFLQATPPGQKFVRGSRGFVKDGVDASLLEFFRSWFARVRAAFGLPIAEEHSLDLLLESRRILDATGECCHR